MSTTDERTQLVMSPDTIEDLWLHTQVPSPRASPEGRAALRRALRERVVLSGGRARVSCKAQALEFIRSEAPEIARRWPAVFGDVAVPRKHQLMSVASHALGETVAGVQLDGDGGLRLEFESGAALVVRGGELDWRHGG